MRICLFEDQAVARLEPLVLTRPVFDLLCGQRSLAEKQFGHFQAHDRGAVVRPFLADLCRLREPTLRVNNLAWLRSDSLVLVNGRWLPPSEPCPVPGPSVGLVEEEIAYVMLEARDAARIALMDLDALLDEWKSSLPQRQAGGRLVHFPWDLVEWNGEELCRDYERNHRPDDAGRHEQAPSLVGSGEHLCIAPSAKIDPFVLVDTTRGPVTIAEDAVVEAFSRLEGPCFIGSGSRIYGARIGSGTTIGPGCHIGGEVEATIIQGHTNKYHDGFLGHSYLGEWVNFGAGTQCSDLRNDYGDVSVAIGGRPVPSGLTKVGCFIGDHTRTGLGTLLNTGTSAGVFCNLLPGSRLLPRYFPSFTSWWMNDYDENSDLDTLLETAAVVMGRRQQLLTDVRVELFRHLLQESEPERQFFLQQARRKGLPRSA
jgi:UDP-N-acetylglucosamine diphosphorylase/glucosamine-1-phosphate N-acetyltransferase